MTDLYCNTKSLPSLPVYMHPATILHSTVIMQCRLLRHIMSCYVQLPSQTFCLGGYPLFGCSSLCYQSDQDLEVTMEAAKEAGITVVSLPLVNQWTQVGAHPPPCT